MHKMYLSVIALLSAVIVYLLLGGDGRLSAPDSLVAASDSIAVLQFTGMSPTQDTYNFADTLRDGIIKELASNPELRVAASASVMAHSVPTPSLARELDVKYFLEGSVQKVNGNARVAVQVTNSVTEQHLWAESYNRGADELKFLPMEIAGKVEEVMARQQ